MLATVTDSKGRIMIGTDGKYFDSATSPSDDEYDNQYIGSLSLLISELEAYDSTYGTNLVQQFRSNNARVVFGL